MSLLADVLEARRRGGRAADPLARGRRSARPRRCCANCIRMPAARTWSGITGPPGAGKSTLVDALIGELPPRMASASG